MVTNSGEPGEKNAPAPLGEVEGWKAMAVRSGACLVCTVVALLLRATHRDASTLWVAAAYVSGGWDLTAKVWQGIRAREFGTDFLMWLVAFGAILTAEASNFFPSFTNSAASRAFRASSARSR